MRDEELKQYFINELGWGWDYQAQAVFNLLTRAATHAKGGVLLDAGAGHQRYRPFFEDCKYLAQEHPIAGAQNKGILEYDILCDVRHIPLEDNSVDVVLSTSSLEHFEYPELFFMEAGRVLKPGGGLFINVPFVYHEHEVPFDFQRPTRYGLERWYRHAGLEKTVVSPSSNSISAATYLFKYAIYEERQRHKSAIGRAVNFFIRRTVTVIAYLLFKMYGVAPLDNGLTTMPIGWGAEGFKPMGNPACDENCQNARGFPAMSDEDVDRVTSVFDEVLL